MKIINSHIQTVSIVLCCSGLGPSKRIFSVNLVTIFANLGASAEDTHSIVNLSGSIPATSRAMRIASLLASAL